MRRVSRALLRLSEKCILSALFLVTAVLLLAEIVALSPIWAPALWLRRLDRRQPVDYFTDDETLWRRRP